MRRRGRRGAVVTARALGWCALAALVLAPGLFLAGRVGLEAVKWAMLAATIVWFAAASVYMWREE